MGVIYVLDEEALGEDTDGSEVPYDDIEVYVVWYDAHRKRVRWRQRAAIDLSQEIALLSTAPTDGHPLWTEAKIGED